jgi:hypothetical protein
LHGYTHEQLKSEGEKYGISDITGEEYTCNSKFSILTALTRIKNCRSSRQYLIKQKGLKYDILYNSRGRHPPRYSHLHYIEGFNVNPHGVKLTTEIITSDEFGNIRSTATPLPAPWTYKEGETPHQLLRKTDEYKSARDKHIKPRCEQCNGTRSLALHHLAGSPPYHKAGLHIMDSILNEFMSSEATYCEIYTITLSSYPLRFLLRAICPGCGKTLTHRKTIQPEFACYACKGTFQIDILLADTIDELSLYADYIGIERKVYRELSEQCMCFFSREISEMYSAWLSHAIGIYLSMRDTETLCQRCHTAIHHGKILCRRCKKHYHNANYDVCFTCFENERHAEDDD